VRTGIFASAAVAAVLLVRHAVAAGEAGASHSDPFASVLLELAVILGAAMLGRWAAGRLNQPSVLGELLIGVLLGNVGYWLGLPMFTLVMHFGDAGTIYGDVWRTGQSVGEVFQAHFTAEQLAPGGIGHQLQQVLTGPQGPLHVNMGVALWIFSNLGVIMLLFTVGLESSVAEMGAVGKRALLVAILGVVIPFTLGVAVTGWLLPEDPLPSHLFVGATLCATSVGITARVLKDLGKMQTGEARVILGAAVIDDVLGLILLAVIVGIVATGEIQPLEIGRITGLSVLFLGTVLLFGERIVRALAAVFESLDRHNAKLLFPLGLAFILAWVANRIELASIVGAFAAGLILSEEHFGEGTAQAKIEQGIAPIEAIFAPVFFVLMGMQVDLTTFVDPATLGLASAFSVVAIVSKLASGFVAGPGHDAISVGIGMIPRGEVGLIFASIGRGLGVVEDEVFAAIVIMVIVTTMITPLGLRWSLFRDQPGSGTSRATS